nr:DUF4113 domain-containing protein [Enterobacter soli]
MSTNDQNTDLQQQWQMKRGMLSPRYTTCYADLLTVR